MPKDLKAHYIVYQLEPFHTDDLMLEIDGAAREAEHYNMEHVANVPELAIDKHPIAMISDGECHCGRVEYHNEDDSDQVIHWYVIGHQVHIRVGDILLSIDTHHTWQPAEPACCEEGGE